MAVHNTVVPQQKAAFGQKHSSTQSKSTFTQKINRTQKKSAEPSALNDKSSNKEQTLTVKPVNNVPKKNPVNVRPKSLSVPHNIPVTNNKELKGNIGQVDESKGREDLMSNLSVPDGKSKTQVVQKKDEDFREKSNSLNDSFLKLKINTMQHPSNGQTSRVEKPEQIVKDEKDEGELIERGPLPSAKKTQSAGVHPYAQRYTPSEHVVVNYEQYCGGVMYAEQLRTNSCDSHLPHPVEEINKSTLNITAKDTEEEIKEEIVTKEFAPVYIRTCELFMELLYPSEGTSTYPSTVPIDIPVFSEPALGNTSPHCSGDSTYGTLSPDSNVMSPMSCTSQIESPFYGGNEFINDSLLNEATSSSLSSSDSGLPSEPVASLELYTELNDLIPDCVYNSRSSNESQQSNESKGFGERVELNVVGNQTQPNIQFYAGVSETNSAAPLGIVMINNNKSTEEIFNNIDLAPSQVQHITSSKLLPSKMSPISTIPPSNINSNFPGINIEQSWDVAYNINDFSNFTAPNMVTTTQPNQVLASVPPADRVQINSMTYQNIHSQGESSHQMPLNIPIGNTASKVMCGRNAVPGVGTEMCHTTNKPSSSVINFICGDIAKKSILKPVTVDQTPRINTPPSVQRPVERPILPAGCGVYEDGMFVPASLRLRDLMMTTAFIIEYVKVNDKLAGKPEQLKQELFCLLSKNTKEKNWLNSVYAHICLAEKQSEATVLTAKYSGGHSLLYLACVNHASEPMIARYIADSLLDLQISPDEDCDINGNSLLHLLASLGDSHVRVLAELLNMRHPKTGQPVFDVNRCTRSHNETPLHIAVSKHSLPLVDRLATVRLLIKHGANVAVQDEKLMTPLHYAVQGKCELQILKLLLEAPTSRAALHVTDEKKNTVLHLASANNAISVSKQKDVILSLIGHGANFRIQNEDLKIPLALIDNDRKQEFKKLFQRKYTLLTSWVEF